MGRTRALALVVLASLTATALGYYVPGTYPQEFREADLLQGAVAGRGRAAGRRRWVPGACRLICLVNDLSRAPFPHLPLWRHRSERGGTDVVRHGDAIRLLHPAFLQAP